MADQPEFKFELTTKRSDEGLAASNPDPFLEMYEGWYHETARTVFRKALFRLYSAVFGEPQRLVHASIVTDLSPPSGPLEFIDPESNPVATRAPEDGVLTPNHIRDGSRIGVLVFHRPRGDALTVLSESGSETNAALLQFENERVRQSEAAASRLRDGRLALTSMELAQGSFSLDAPIDIVVVGPSSKHHPFLATPLFTPIARLKDWAGYIHDWLCDCFEQAGGEAGFVICYVDGTWYDRKVQEKLDRLVQQELEKAPPEVLAGVLPLERIAAIAESRLVADAQAIEGSFPQSLETRLLRADAALHSLQSPVRAVVRLLLEDINSVPQENRSLGSLEKNQDFARSLQRLVSEAGLRLCCPSCQSPGSFVCKAGNSPDGAFAFSHGKGESKLGKRGCGGWSTIPDLKLT